jgi:dihydroxyacetone synthase
VDASAAGEWCGVAVAVGVGADPADTFQDEDHPSLFALSRQPVPLLPGSDRAGVARGGYVVHGDPSIIPDITLLATGAEVSRAIEVAKLLSTPSSSSSTYTVRVVSLPYLALFDRQSAEYRRGVIPSSQSLVVAIEAWASFGWSRYAHAGAHMHTFGLSAPQQVLYEHFGFGVQNLAEKIGGWAESRKAENGGWNIPGVGEYEELLLGTIQEH